MAPRFKLLLPEACQDDRLKAKKTVMIKCGIDLVFVPEFEKRLNRSSEKFLRKIFLPNELKKIEVAHLAGILAAKEAIIKALGLPSGSWHQIEISYDKRGQPKAQTFQKGIKESQLSISHSGDYAVAVFIASPKAKDGKKSW